MTDDLIVSIKRLNDLYPYCPAGSDWYLMTDERKKAAGFPGLKAYQENGKILATDDEYNDKRRIAENE